MDTPTNFRAAPLAPGSSSHAVTPSLAVLGAVGIDLIRVIDDEFPGFDDVEDVVSWLETGVDGLPSTFDFHRRPAAGALAPAANRPATGYARRRRR